MEDFPDSTHALVDPNGLLAVGGDLSADRLLLAYSKGIFPWYGEGDPILWWTPDPRCVLLPEEFKISKTLRKAMKLNSFSLTWNQAFAAVMEGCAGPRSADEGTWIDGNMASAYQRLHRLGYAHSVDVWQQDRLVGGLYGVALGSCFFGESMFHRVTEASKVALAGLVWRARTTGIDLIDCQVSSDHLLSLGAKNLPRQHFENLLARAIKGVGTGEETDAAMAAVTGFPATSTMLSALKSEGGTA